MQFLHIYKKNRILSAVMIILILISCFSYGKVHAVSVRDVDTSQNKKYPSASDIAGNASVTDAGFVPADAPAITSQAAIVMDLDTGDILYEKASHQAMYPASITKVLTCLLAIENGNVNDIITVSESDMDQVEEGSSAIGLQAGEQLTLKDALYGMMLNSGNECALAISDYISGSTSQFADLMNKTARDLGCTDSNFVNPNGLHNPDHYTTCYDMALIGRAAYQYPEFKKLISTQSYTIPETNMNEERPLWQENRLTFAGNGEYYYQYCTGGKTGYTVDALATLISFAERDGKRLVTVVMKCEPTTDSYLDTIKLDEFCFSHYRLCKPLIDYKFQNNFQSNYYENSDILTNFYNDLEHRDFRYYVNQDYSFYIRSFVNDSDINMDIEYYDKITDDKRGRVIFSYNGSVLGETEILVERPAIEASSTDALKNRVPEEETEVTYMKWLKRIIVVLIILIIVFLVILLIIKIHKRFQYYQSKRSVRYYPISKDARLNKKKEEAARKSGEKDGKEEVSKPSKPVDEDKKD